MENNQPYIEIKHSADAEGAMAVASTYDMDKGPLMLPAHIVIGGKSYDGSKITCYKEQVEEYDVWLEDQIKAGNTEVMQALDDIYNKAIANGIILKTRCVPAPYITHAHVVKNVIMKLA